MMNEKMLALVANCIKDYDSKLGQLQKIEDYYNGITDVAKSYVSTTDQPKNKLDVNFFKKFVKEEVSYTLGNSPTYIAKNNTDNVTQIFNIINDWENSHNLNLLEATLKFGWCAELYYVVNTPVGQPIEIATRILTPLNCYIYKNDDGVIELILRFYDKKFDTDNKFVDIITFDTIYKANIDDIENAEESQNIFGFIPVSECKLDENGNDIIFKDIKALQDAFETNLSDSSNEVSALKNAYLVFAGLANSEENDAELIKMKDSKTIRLDSPDSRCDFINKNINDSFVQNTLKNEKDLIYELSGHINNNEEMVSNTSSIALRTRMIQLEMKCKYNINALKDCFRNRHKLLFAMWNATYKTVFDYKDIITTFTPSIPTDDALMANIINFAGDSLSLETKVGLFSFINNPALEAERVRAEQKEKEKLNIQK